MSRDRTRRVRYRDPLTAGDPRPLATSALHVGRGNVAQREGASHARAAREDGSSCFRTIRLDPPEAASPWHACATGAGRRILDQLPPSAALPRGEAAPAKAAPAKAAPARGESEACEIYLEATPATRRRRHNPRPGAAAEARLSAISTERPRPGAASVHLARSEKRARLAGVGGELDLRAEPDRLLLACG